MFDVARALAFAWALFAVARAKAWREAAALAVVAYLFGLSVASGFSVRENGPMAPLLALPLGLLGPSSLPRGPLPALPLAHVVVAWPVLPNAAGAALLLALAWRLARSVAELPPFSDVAPRVSRAALALSLVGVCEGLGAATRALPYLLDWGAGGQVFDQ